MSSKHNKSNRIQGPSIHGLVIMAVIVFALLASLYRALYPPITIKTADEIDKMRVAGKLAAEVLTYITPFVKAGTSTGELDDLCKKYISEEQLAIAAPLNYRGFPKSTCISVNDVVCHGIPSYSEVLQDGDIVNIDVTVIKDGYHGDTSKTFLVGEVDEQSRKLSSDTRAALFEGMRMVRPGVTTGDLGHAIQAMAEAKGYGVVRDFTGHGTGLSFHEGPRIVHAGWQGWGVPLQEGMTVTIEPMLNLGSSSIKVMSDGWTAKTADGKRSAQWEHTILVTKSGYEILTLREEEVREGIERTGEPLKPR